ncbi:MAG: AAA family ATPase [Euryarchaeota archaeon]|nr:AAA family ATPase [Euryarchaeota archaeon]
MYKRLTIDGFRGIKHLETEDFRQVNLVVGENNCGKTVLLECLFLLMGPTNTQLPLKINTLREFGVVDENTWSVFFNKLNINSDIKLSGELDKPGEERNLVIKCNYSGTQNHYSGDFTMQELSKTWSILQPTGNLTAECAEGRRGKING